LKEKKFLGKKCPKCLKVLVPPRKTCPYCFVETGDWVDLSGMAGVNEEEARVAVLLSPMPEEASRIAGRAGIDEAQLASKLESMSKRGLIFRVRRRGRTHFSSAPFMIGLYEYSVKRMGKELAGLYRECYETAYLAEMGASNVPGFKVIPITEKVAADTALYPFAGIRDQVRSGPSLSKTGPG